MKKALKRCLSFLLAIAIIFGSAYAGLSELDFSGLFVVEAKAATSGTCGDNLTWILDDEGTLTVSGTGAMTNYSSSEFVPWYSSRSSIESVIINDSVTSIGDYAFFYCTSLTLIEIPNSVKTIGDYAFNNCIGLTDVYYDGYQSDWENIIIGSDNSYLTNVTIHYHEHSYSAEWIVDIEPTCTETGSKHNTCSACGDVITEAIPATGHNYSTEWMIDVWPTGTTEGSKSHHCLACDSTTDITSIPASPVIVNTLPGDNKIYLNTQISPNQESVEGIIIYYEFDKSVLDISDFQMKLTSGISVNDYTYDGLGYSVAYITLNNFNTGEEYVDFFSSGFEFISEDAASATVKVYCREFLTADGDDSNDVVQDVPVLIGEFLLVDNCTTEVDGALTWKHTIENGTIVTPATCTQEGLISGLCSTCGEDATEAIPASGHTYGEWITDTEPTCTKEGSKHQVCSACGDTVTDSITAIGHSYSSEWTVDEEPDCTQVGSKSHHCTVCGDKTDITEIEALGHSYGEWITDTEPTCTDEGLKYRTCSVCGDTVTEAIDATGHSYSSEWTVDEEPDCTQVGSKSHHCTVCDDKTDITEIVALGHSYGEWITDTEPTCTDEGSKHHICSACGDTATGSIAANGHSYSTEWTLDIAPTCTEEGSKSHHCTVCGEKSDITAVLATGHSYVVQSTENEHPHTIAYKCSACGAEKAEVTTVSDCVECNFTLTAIDTSSYKLVSYISTQADVVISSSYDGRAITTIANGCFKGNTEITSVKISNSVTSIGALAFMNCASLKKVVIPASVTSIGAQAFYGFTGTIYCTGGSTAHEYAVANNIDYVLLSILETEYTQIDYDNFVIYTQIQNCVDILEIINVSETAMAIPTASHICGNLEFLGTGTVITVFDGNEYIGDFTLVVEGDTNGDSVCDVLDASQVATASVGKTELTGAYAMAADSNSDDVVDITDYQAIVNKAVA